MIKKPSVSVYFDSRRIKEGHFSVKLSVYFQDQQKLFSTGLIVPTKDADFLKANELKLSGKVKDERLRNLWDRVYNRDYYDDLSDKQLETQLFRAQQIIADLGKNFTFQEFAHRYNTSSALPTAFPVELLAGMDFVANELLAEERFSQHSIFTSAKASLVRYATQRGLLSPKSAKIPFGMITVSFLNDYERFMRSNGAKHRLQATSRPASPTTIDYYLKCVYKTMKRAIKEGVIPEESWPFGRDKYRTPKVRNIKKALPSDAISQILEYKSSQDSRNFARDMWLFSYLCNGLNFSDLARLTWGDFDRSANTISFTRAKTRDTKKENETKVVVHLLPEAIEIINRRGNPISQNHEFIFPFLEPGMDELTKKKKISRLVNRVNRRMLKVADELSIDAKFNTYEARHSFATTLARAEVPLAFISQKLGHSNLSTTQKYLGAFELEQTQKYLSALIPKKQESQDS